MCESIDPPFLWVQPISFRSILMIASQIFEPLCSRSVNHSVTSSGRRASAFRQEFYDLSSTTEFHSPPFPPLHYPLIQFCVLLFSRPGQDDLLFWQCHDWAQNVTHLVYDMHVMLSISFFFFFLFWWTGLPCFQSQTDIKELLETLGQNVVTKKRKNVEILWTAGTVSGFFSRLVLCVRACE